MPNIERDTVGAPTIATLLNEATATLEPRASARLDAELLLGAVLELTRAGLYRESESPVEPHACAAYAALIADRKRGVPVPYLTGQTEFWSLPLEVTRHVLVPRPESELVVACGLALITAVAAPRVIDLGTGSGALAAAFANERPDAFVVASDCSMRAARVARRNFEHLGLQRVAVVVADWLDAVTPRSFDMILANPPYIGAEERATLGPELAHEPPGALFAADGGLADLERIISTGRENLRGGGHIVVEHGYRQGAGVRALFRTSGYTRIETRRDLAGHERVTSACLDG